MTTPSAGTPCDDGNDCTAVDACVSGVCVGSAIPGCCRASSDCADDDGCTTDACVAGSCVNRAIDCAITTCDDSDPCTLDSCDRTLGCAHAPIHSADCASGTVHVFFNLPPYAGDVSYTLHTLSDPSAPDVTGTAGGNPGGSVDLGFLPQGTYLITATRPLPTTGAMNVAQAECVRSAEFQVDPLATTTLGLGLEWQACPGYLRLVPSFTDPGADPSGTGVATLTAPELTSGLASTFHPSRPMAHSSP